MGALPAVSLEALTAAACEENRQAARKISACYDVHRSWITLDTKHKHYSRYGRTEMAAALGCSATVAESYVSVGVALNTRLPLVKKAFEAGEIDLPRVRTICRILDNLSDDIVRMVEDEIVEAARRNSPGPLEQEIWDILVRVAPEEAAALREFAKRFRTVTYTPAGELTRIRAELTAPEAAAAWQLLEEMADTLCPKDPRGKKERLCDAFMARMHGEPRLECLCQREDCPKKDTALPDRRVPLTMITVDVATLIGLLANPAYLAGDGSIDPDLARELARNSHWQILLTEAITLAESLGLAVQNPETGEWERAPKDQTQEPGSESQTATTGTEPDAGSGTNAAATSATEPHNCTGSNPEPEPETEAESCTTTDASADVVTDAATAPNTEPANESATREESDTESTSASSPDPAQAPAPMPTPEPGTAPDRTETRSAPDQPERTGTVPPTSGPPPATSPTQGTVLASDPETATAPAPMDGQAGETPAHSTAEPAPPDSSGGSDNQRRTQSLTSAAALFCTHTPVGRGTRHSSALDLDAIRHPAHNMRALDLRSTNRPDHRTGCTAGGLYLGNATLAAALEAAIAADPTLGTSVPRGPLTDRALIYRPDTLTTAAVRHRDRHCRFPGCHRPAARCQLDHVNPFDHANPLGGGWTTVNNLQCLCEYHHSVKTAGYWKAVMLPGGAILWTSTSKTTRITLPANGTAVPILGNDLRPHIPTTPRNSGIIAYPNPPDNDELDTDDTAAPPF
nr:DUF222 domain-containing protein [uncultured Rhodococcus sp.]